MALFWLPSQPSAAVVGNRKTSPFKPATMLSSLAADWHPPQPSVAILARYYKTRTVQARKPLVPAPLQMTCNCGGWPACCFVAGWQGCQQNIGRHEKKWNPDEAKQMCHFCATHRDSRSSQGSGASSSTVSTRAARPDAREANRLAPAVSATGRGADDRFQG